MLKLNDRIMTSEDTVARKVGDEVVLLNLVSGIYFGLDEVGAVIWQVVEDEGPVVLETIRNVLAQQYDVSEDVAGRDLLALSVQLIENGLAERVAS